MRFTDRSIAALKPKATLYEVWEDGRTGLGVRMSPKGRKSWNYMYRFNGKARRMTLGTYPAVSLASARVKHANAQEKKERGIDPGTLHVERRRAERQAETMAELIDEYLEKYARPNKRTADADERALGKEVLPLWGRRKAASITRRDVIKLLDGIVERGSPIMANRLLEIIRRMFAFGVKRDILDSSPCFMVEPPAKETPRDRVLSPDEIKAFWTGLEKAKMSDPTRLALKLMLATGQRRSEIIGASWSEFDLDSGAWGIPAVRTKAARAHRVPLSSLALDLLTEVRRIGGDSGWLFPSPRRDGPMASAVVSHAVRNNLDRIGVAQFTPHDLRRTCASGLAELSIDRLIVGKVLGHADQSITGVYDRYGYWPEKKRALDAWGARLTEIISGEPAADNVVRLAAGRAGV